MTDKNSGQTRHSVITEAAPAAIILGFSALAVQCGSLS